jgi:L-aminopeptidase/D-esterase-like protein
MNRREFAQSMASFAALGGVQAPAPSPSGGSLTDVRGIRVGHFTDSRRPTGCTAILFDNAVAAGVDYNGSAPGESQVVMLQPVSPVEKIHALFLTGGGIFALQAHGGVIRYLEEHKVGFDWGTPDLRIPIVVSAVIDDLAVGNPRIRPDVEAAYKACAAATSSPVPEGNVGAGAGATVGKMHRGRGLSGMKGGLGTASITAGDVVIGALAVVNAAITTSPATSSTGARARSSPARAGPTEPWPTVSR